MQAVDQKKEEFQRYLEKSGVLDSITRLLAALNDLPEKPEDARDFVREFLTGVGPTETQVLQDEIERLKRELEDKNTKISDLEELIRDLNLKLSQK